MIFPSFRVANTVFFLFFKMGNKRNSSFFWDKKKTKKKYLFGLSLLFFRVIYYFKRTMV